MQWLSLFSEVLSSVEQLCYHHQLLQRDPGYIVVKSCFWWWTQSNGCSKLKKRPTCTESDFWMLSIRLWTRSSCFSFPVTTNMQWTNIQKKNIELSRADSPSMVYKTCSNWGTNNPQQKITVKCASKEFCTGQVLHWKILLMTTWDENMHQEKKIVHGNFFEFRAQKCVEN